MANLQSISSEMWKTGITPIRISNERGLYSSLISFQYNTKSTSWSNKGGKHYRYNRGKLSLFEDDMAYIYMCTYIIFNIIMCV